MWMSEKKKIKAICNLITSEKPQLTLWCVPPTHVHACTGTVHRFALAGGYLAHSLAIMTDAAHLLADVGSMLGSLFSLWLSTRPATRTMTFGWHRSGMAPA